MLRTKAGLPHALAALACFASSLVLFWPGIALYDSVDQYGQILSGAYWDWHPPIMARLWSLFRPWWPGTAPMLALQLGFYWLGLGLIATACARRDRRAGGWAVLAVGAWLFASCWMGAVLKDSQMVGALAAATGILGWYRIEGRRRPLWASALAILLLVYAALVRANAVFAVAPLALAGLGWPGLAGWKQRAAATAGLVLALILAAPVVNHRLLGAIPSGVEKSLLVYDIGGTAARAGVSVIPGTSDSAWRTLSRSRCYSALEWDRLGEDGCVSAPLLGQSTFSLVRLWLTTVARHPLAYAAHRFAHFNATMRLLVPANLPHAVSPVDSESNALGLGALPKPALGLFHDFGRWCSNLPLSWPLLWLALDLVALWAAAGAAPGPLRDPALALSLSALAMGASFLVVSVASDLRYHLWTMLAAMLAFPLLASAGAFSRRHWTAAGLILAAVSLAGWAARLLLAPYA